MSYNTYRDTNHSYYDIKYMNNNPIYPKFWRNDPLRAESLIDPRRDGYRPYFQYKIATKQDYWVDSDCMVVQFPCDMIEPVNRCYVKNHQIVEQP